MIDPTHATYNTLLLIGNGATFGLVMMHRITPEVFIRVFAAGSALTVLNDVAANDFGIHLAVYAVLLAALIREIHRTPLPKLPELTGQHERIDNTKDI